MPPLTSAEQTQLAELNARMAERGRQIASSLRGEFGLDSALAGYVEGMFEGEELPEPGSDAEGRFVYAFQCAMAAALHDRLFDARLEREREVTSGEDAPAPAGTA